MYSRVVFVLNSLWCHCYCCFLLMKSIIKLWGLFFLSIRKKKYWPASKSYSSWRPISKANKLFCFVSFFFSWILVLFFLFFSLIYFILFYYFFCGGARSFYRSPVQCYWYCQYLTIFYKSHICQRNANEIYAEENNQCLRFCHRMYFTQRTYHERKEIS